MAAPVVWFEIAGRDLDALTRFYGDLLGWKVDADNPQRYGMVDTGAEGGIPGGIYAPGDPVGEYVSFYAGVQGLEGYLERAERLGGKVVQPAHADLGDGQGGDAAGSRGAPDRAARAVLSVGAARRSPARSRAANPAAPLPGGRPPAGSWRVRPRSPECHDRSGRQPSSSAGGGTLGRAFPGHLDSGDPVQAEHAHGAAQATPAHQIPVALGADEAQRLDPPPTVGWPCLSR